MKTNLEVSREERVLRLTLNRPEKRNALNVDLCRAISDAVDEAQTDASVGSILLAGEGNVFCAGMDLAEALSADCDALTAVHERLFTIGARTRKPIVAAVAGPALAGGVGLIANAHVVVAAHGSSFGLTEIRVGMWPFAIYPAIEAALGERRALELSLTGRIFHVPEAVQWGLVTEAAMAVEVEDRAMTIAMHLAGSSPQAMEAGLRYVAETRGASPQERLACAARYRAQAFASADFREGVAAFLEKRRPVWSSVSAGD
jgi:enoyl-CoA hydratase/carnithine racemase